jgi:alkanesulfonate monooxygenase SsuD/methylene tetrahydromethanopterin reductase-like flavin-dependent oxidoreductase (luciferase family)
VDTRVALGLVLLMVERPDDGAKPTWADITAMARRGEELRADTVWVPDEIIWRVTEWPGPRGWWDCLTMAGAIAATTSTVKVGTWVMSALQHNPGMVVRAAESLDEISGGRFVLGLGSGHGGEAEALGYPGDKTVSRYLEALEIIVPLLRGESAVTFEGQFHHAINAEVRPRGPRPGRIPLMMAGHADRTMTAAARHADIWSAYATSASGSLPEAFVEMTSRLDRICEGIGRDPATIGRSVGVFVEPGSAKSAEATGFGVAITGSGEQIIDAIAGFSGVGVTRVEVIPWPTTLEVVEQLAPVFAAFATPGKKP